MMFVFIIMVIIIISSSSSSSSSIIIIIIITITIVQAWQPSGRQLQPARPEEGGMSFKDFL